MDTTTHRPASTITRALRADDSSVRLRAAMAAGSTPDQALVRILIERSAVEPDFFVRDMLTWALTRHPDEVTVPLLLHEVGDGTGPARRQALHTLSKIRDPRGWSAITRELLLDADADVARAAWRAAVVLVPEREKRALADVLATRLGRGEPDLQRSLSRALAALGDAADEPIAVASGHPDPHVRTHAAATHRLIDDPDADFGAAVAEARRVHALGSPRGGSAGC
ncbi:HEAT repeat domain-containing protein [Gordonia iterans]